MFTYRCSMSANLNAVNQQQRQAVYEALARAGWKKIDTHEIEVSTVWVRSFELGENLSREIRANTLVNNFNNAFKTVKVPPRAELHMVVQFGNSSHFEIEFDAAPMGVLMVTSCV